MNSSFLLDQTWIHHFFLTRHVILEMGGQSHIKLSLYAHLKSFHWICLNSYFDLSVFISMWGNHIMIDFSMDAATMSSIVKLLKDLKHVHVFILAYKENDHRATQVYSLFIFIYTWSLGAWWKGVLFIII